MTKNETNITDLPNEVLDDITNYLNYEDLKCLRQVNKHFYSILTDKKFVKNEYVNFYKDSCVQNITEILLQSQREFYCFSFYKIDFSDEIIKIFDKFSNLIDIELVECNIDEKFLSRILLSCPLLKSLRFHFCKSLFMPGVIFSRCPTILDQKCNNLKSLSFENSSYLSDYILDQFVQICPNLETLNFAETPINFHKGLCKRYYSEIYDKPANSVLTLFLIHIIIEKNASNIRNLNFSSTNIDGESLQEICTIPTLKLKSLNLSNCKEIRKSFKFHLGDWQPNLIELNLKKCPAVTNESLQHIFLTMPNLKFLSIEECPNVTQDGLQNISNLCHLESLNISDCNIKYHLASMENDYKNLSLKDFRCGNIYILENDLENFESNISMTFLNSVTYLDLSFIALKNSVLKAIVKNCFNLKNLILSRCLYITDKFFVDENNFELDHIKNLKNLQSISLDYCNISDVTIINSFNLLDLRRCSLSNTKVTSAGVNSLVKQCPRIEYLNLDYCDIDNFCIENIVVLKRLHSLSLANCWKIEEKSISLLFNIYGHFKYLNISGIRNITQELIKKISEENLVRQKFLYSILVMSNSYFNRSYPGNSNIAIF